MLVVNYQVQKHVTKKRWITRREYQEWETFSVWSSFENALSFVSEKFIQKQKDVSDLRIIRYKSQSNSIEQGFDDILILWENDQKTSNHNRQSRFITYYD